MSWSELERLVEDAESTPELRGALQDCHSQEDLLLAARRRGYRITRMDLQRAALEDLKRRRSRGRGTVPAEPSLRAYRSSGVPVQGSGLPWGQPPGQ